MISKIIDVKKWKLSMLILLLNIYQKRYKFYLTSIILGYLYLVMTCRSKRHRIRKAKSLHSTTVLVTGANSGIGKKTAQIFASRGARVIMACRDLEKGNSVADEIRKNIGATVTVRQLDLASLNSVREFCQLILETEPQINILINNAGIMMTPQGKTTDGFELQFGTNHLGHFLLTLLLLDRIKASAPARIINLSSAAHIVGKIHWDDINLETNYKPFKAYCQSKLANVLFTKELARRLNGSQIQVFAIHPGIVDTELFKFLPNIISGIKKYIFMSSGRAARDIVNCAINEKFSTKTGTYFSVGKEALPSFRARDEEDAKRLWTLSLKMVGLEECN